jgi:hypothetical protein
MKKHKKPIDISIFVPIALLVFIASLSCSPSPTLNLKIHDFWQRPLHIVWIQVPGMKLKHFSPIVHGLNQQEIFHWNSFLGKMDCVGQVWTHNYMQKYTTLSQQLNMSHWGHFLSDVHKTKNPLEHLTNKQEIWGSFLREGYRVGLLDLIPENKIYALIKEHQNQLFLKNSTPQILYWNTFKPITEKDKDQYNDFPNFIPIPMIRPKSLAIENGMYTSENCQGTQCEFEQMKIIDSLQQTLRHNSARTMTIIRDFSYLSYIQSGKKKDALDSLSRIKTLWEKITEESINQSQLVILSFPYTFNLEPVLKQDFIGEVYAHGKGAEHFCGVYDLVDFYHRFFFLSKRKELPQDFKKKL